MYRYRVLRSREARDGDAMIVPVHIEGHWLCAICSEDNTDDWGRCVFCNRPVGTWRCEDCGHLNKPDEKECEECGVEKPEAD